MFDEELIERRLLQHPANCLGSRSIAVGIGEARERCAKFGTKCAIDCFLDRVALRRRVNYIVGTFTALLAHADVNHGQSE